MKFIKITILFFVFQTTIFSQTYEISYWQSNNYDTLQHANSIILEYLFDDDDYIFWEKDFDFGFSFPFFDSVFTSIYIDSDAVGIFGDSDDYNLSLYGAAYGVYSPYDKGNSTLDTPLISDMSYTYDVIGQEKVFKIEWKNVGFFTEVDVLKIEDHYLNFQAWFYENGTIEIHFGDIDVSNSELFVEGEGFYLPGSSAAIGPWIYIVDYFQTRGFLYGGLYDDPILFPQDTFSDTVLNIPPEGWVVRFEYQKEVATNNLSSSDLDIYPTITSSNLNIISAHENVNSKVYNVHGQKIFESDKKILDVSAFPKGLYFIRMESGDDLTTLKFTKI